MKKLLYLIIIYIPFLLTACDVHEWPETPESVKFNLRLNYETNLTKWYHLLEKTDVIEEGYGETYDNHQQTGLIRYIVRAYPVWEKQRANQAYTKEFVFTKNIIEGYNHEVSLELPEGEYNIMVWSDLVQKNKDPFFHNADNFAEIVLQGDHQGNTDYRDAFQGTGNIKLEAQIVEYVPSTCDITMQRPLAKYEFQTTDLQEFYKEELEYLTKMAESRGEELPTRVNTDNYKVKFVYAGYMPNTYNMYADKPIDSKMGVLFESKLNVLGENEASLGFDYVFVNHQPTSVMVQIGFYDDKGRQVALSKPIQVPLKRDFHTILRGTFLTKEASGGLIIDPEFDGDHNVVIK